MRVKAVKDFKIQIGYYEFEIKQDDEFNFNEITKMLIPDLVIPVREKKIEKQITLTPEKAVTL